MGSRSKKRIGILVCCVLAALWLNGCVSGWQHADKAQKNDAGYEIPESSKLVVYTSHKEEVYEPIIKEFEERTGIFVEVRQGDTLQLFQEIADRQGAPACDVVFGGGIENYVAYQSCLEAYRVEEEDMIDERYRTSGHKWTAFSVLPIVFIYNDKLVYPVAAPRTWAELQTDRWQGRVAFADPLRSGSSYTALCTMMQALPGEKDEILQKFSMTLGGAVSVNSGAVLDEVNTGRKLVGITLEETARKRIAEGADLSMLYPQEGTSAVPDGAAIIDGALHRENAQKFLDFVVSRDVQQLLVDRLYRQSVRTDIELPDVERMDGPKLKILDYDIVWAAENRDSILEKWAELQQ